MITPGGKPPYRIAGNPPGIISTDDYDVTGEALAFLALAPEIAALVLDMAGAIGVLAKEYGRERDVAALLSRLDRVKDGDQ